VMSCAGVLGAWTALSRDDSSARPVSPHVSSEGDLNSAAASPAPLLQIGALPADPPREIAVVKAYAEGVLSPDARAKPEPPASAEGALASNGPAEPLRGASLFGPTQMLAMAAGFKVSEDAEIRAQAELER